MTPFVLCSSTLLRVGPCSGLKATSRCVALSDGSACVVRRSIPADNSCLFNAVGGNESMQQIQLPNSKPVGFSIYKWYTELFSHSMIMLNLRLDMLCIIQSQRQAFLDRKCNLQMMII